MFQHHQKTPPKEKTPKYFMMYVGMKRGREGEFEAIKTMANCLMLLSRGHDAIDSESRVFECKTCNRQFASFQALGGHRASHKKPKFTEGEVLNQETKLQISPPKPKTHECSICGLEFAIGQALGGHMRRHRAVAALNENRFSPELSLSIDSEIPRAVPVVKRSNSRRVMCLDLNLTPLENDLDFPLDQKAVASMLHCYL